MLMTIRKDDMGYNWLLSVAGLVLAYGAQKSFPTPEDADEAFKMITRDLLVGIDPTFSIRVTIGLYAIETPNESPMRFAGLFESAIAANKQAVEVLKFIEVC